MPLPAKKPPPAGDARLVELERVLFPPKQESHKGTYFSGPTLKASTEGAQQSQAYESAPPSSRLAPQHGSNGSRHRRRGGSNASPSRHIHTAHFGFNPLNPFESVVDAAPAIRHLQPHSWRQLELALPPGCSPEVQQELKAELTQHLRSNTSLIGARVSSTPQGRPMAYGMVPPLNLPPLAPNAQGALSSRIGSEAPFSPAMTTNTLPSPHACSQSVQARSLAAPLSASPQEGRLPPISAEQVSPPKLTGLPTEAMAAASAADAVASPRSCHQLSLSRPSSARQVEDLKSSLPRLQHPIRPSSSDSVLDNAANGVRTVCEPAHASREGRRSASPGAPAGSGTPAGARVGTPAGGVNGPRTPLPSVPASTGGVVGLTQGGGDGVPCCATLQPAGIGSVGPWVERRGVELGSSTQASHAPAATNAPMPPVDSGAAASGAAWGSTLWGTPGGPPLAKSGGVGGGYHGSCAQQPSAARAGYGPAATAAVVAASGGALPAGNTPGGPPVTLGALVSERQSVRRQAQLIAEWMEASVARLWQQHAQQVTKLGMRAALANRHVSAVDASTARPPQGAMAANSVFAGSFSKEPHFWHSPEPSAVLHPPEQHTDRESRQLKGRGQNDAQGGAVRSEAEFGDSMPSHPPLSERSMVSEMRSSVHSGGSQFPCKGKQSTLKQGTLQSDVFGLQHALSVLSGAGSPRTGSKANTDQTSDKEDLAGRFAAFVQGSMLAVQQGDSASADASQQMWREMLQVVSAASTALVEHVGEGCWEEGALLSRLWNLHTALITSGMESANSCAVRAEREAEQLRSQVKRLDPLIEWDKAAQQELVDLRACLSEQGASLHLACAERDGLLRENDKIIGHYKKELRKMRQDQRRGQWRLAKKLKNTHNQLALMQRDRQSLMDAVAYTRNQATEMVGIITNVNNHFQRLQANHAELLEAEGFSMADLLIIENGLRNMAATAKRVQEVNKEAEDQHFQTEEEVTAVIAADDVEDEEVDAIMAGGDPDKQDEPPPDHRAAEEAKAAEERARLEEEQRAAEEQAEQEALERAEAEAAQKEQEAAAAAEKASAEEKAAAEQAATEDKAAVDPAAAEEAAAEEATAEAAADEAAGAEGPSADPASPGEAKEEAPKLSPPPTRGSPKGHKEHVRDRVGSSQASSRASSKAASLHEVGIQTMPVQLSPQEIKQEERRVQDLLRVRERKLAEQLMEAFDIEMDRDLLQAKRAAASPVSASPVSSRGGSRSASPDMDRRSPHAGKRGAVDLSRMGRMHALEEEDTGSPGRPLSSPSPGPASSPNQEQPSFLEMVAARIRGKVEGLQAAMEASAQSTESSRPESPDNAIITAKLNLATQDLKSLQDQLLASTSLNRELESKLKVVQEAKGSIAPTPRPIDDRSTLSSPAEPKGKETETEKAQVHRKPKDTKRAKSSYRQSRVSSISFHEKGDKSREQASRRPSPVSSRQQQRDTASPPPPEPSKWPEARAFVLGRKGNPEQRQQNQISGAARLEEAMAKYAGIKPRTPEWLLKLIDGIYRGKIVSDETRTKMVPPQEPIPLVDYMFQHLAGVYGTSSLVNQYAAQLVSTIKANLEVDTRVRVFYHFLMEDRWPRKVLSVFLDGLKRLSEPARLPCCDFPADWSGTKKGGHPLADVRKCLWVADKVLMRRHTRTAYNFAAALALKGEPIPEPELLQYFVAPGYYGQELQQMLEYERGRAEFRKVQTHVFLEELCDEYQRCETVFSEVLPALHKKWDTNNDGFLSLEDVKQMMKHMAQSGMEEDQIEAETSLFWQEAHKLENSADESLAMPQASATSLQATEGTEPSTSAADPKNADGLIGVEAFVGAAQENNFIRLYVRLHKTPPPKKPASNAFNSELRARMLLLAYIQNHWKLHGASLTRLFSSTTPSMEVLLHQQVQGMLNAKDGARKAMALHKLFKLLINRKLDCMISQLPSANTGTHEVNESFPVDIARLTRAIKVLYGADIIIADDMRSMAQEAWDPVSAKSLVGRLQLSYLGEAIKVYNSLRAPMRTHAARFLSASPAFVASFNNRFKPLRASTPAGGHTPQAAEQQEGALGVKSDSFASMPGVNDGEPSMRSMVSNNPTPSSPDRQHNVTQDAGFEQEGVAAESSFGPSTPKQDGTMDSPASQDGAQSHMAMAEGEGS